MMKIRILLAMLVALLAVMAFRGPASAPADPGDPNVLRPEWVAFFQENELMVALRAMPTRRDLGLLLPCLAAPGEEVSFEEMSRRADRVESAVARTIAGDREALRALTKDAPAWGFIISRRQAPVNLVDTPLRTPGHDPRVACRARA